MMLRHIAGLAVALTFTLMIFLGASFFVAVWSHYFADEPKQTATGEVSVKIISPPAPDAVPSCEKNPPCPAPPHD